MALVPLPQEFRGQTIDAGWEQLTMVGESEGKPSDWDGKIDLHNHRAILQVPALTAGKTAQFLIKYPTIGMQGHTITCTVLVEGQQVAQRTERIVP